MTLHSLKNHAAQMGAISLKGLSHRRANRPIKACGWTMSTARQYLDDKAEDLLIAHADEVRLDAAVSRLFAGELINSSEHRPALHWSLRAARGEVSDDALQVRDSIEPALQFAADVLAGGQFDTVIHIGIGGSDFGPRLIYDAFGGDAAAAIDLRFCANVDPYDLERALAGADPSRTLVVGVSKSFGTEETLYNLGRAKAWLGETNAPQIALVTANPERALAWAGDTPVRIFDMPESVGGRFSLWSAASLSCMIALGPDVFRRILSGARAMDRHVQTADTGDNLPMLLALLDFWNASVREQAMRVTLAYSNRLRLLPTYLQQLEMESNGKTVSPGGEALGHATVPAIWGGEGSIGQHSYHQWLHQGAQSVPAEFILALDKGAEPEGQTALVAHALAQAEVLANGRTLEQVRAEEPGVSDAIAAQKVHPGGRPSTVLSCNDFNAEAFGSLIALYEHRTYLAGVLWGLNPFDQWGVERGKTMAQRLKSVLTGGSEAEDPVTAGLVEQLRGE
ncbi:MAG: glucose-6-phosphate isomerase [Pseudomonadota bacterium]